MAHEYCRTEQYHPGSWSGLGPRIGYISLFAHINAGLYFRGTDTNEYYTTGKVTFKRAGETELIFTKEPASKKKWKEFCSNNLNLKTTSLWSQY